VRSLRGCDCCSCCNVRSCNGSACACECGSESASGQHQWRREARRERQERTSGCNGGGTTAQAVVVSASSCMRLDEQSTPPDPRARTLVDCADLLLVTEKADELLDAVSSGQFVSLLLRLKTEQTVRSFAAALRHTTRVSSSDTQREGGRGGRASRGMRSGSASVAAGGSVAAAAATGCRPGDGAARICARTNERRLPAATNARQKRGASPSL